MKQRMIAVFGVLVLLFSLIMTLPASAEKDPSDQIPDDAVWWKGHAYRVYNHKVSWEEAVDACERMGGHLATITSAEEQAIIEEMVVKEKVTVWLGAKMYSSGSFYWITDESFSYTNWASGEPSNALGLGTEPYLGMYGDSSAVQIARPNGEWNNFSGITFNVQGYVCEWQPHCLGPDGTVHDEHEEPQLRITTKPTCTSTGVQEEYCPRCNDVLDTTELEILAHNYGEVTILSGSKIIPPIVKERTCMDCGHVESIKDWSYVWVPILILIGAVGIAFAVLNYVKAFRKK